MGKISTLAWGKPTFMCGGVTLDNHNAMTSLLTIEENDIKGDGVLFRVPDPEPIALALSFDVDIAPETLRNLRRLFKRRIPRKRKKYVKTQISKRFSIKVKQLKFNLNVFNNQKR